MHSRKGRGGKGERLSGLLAAPLRLDRVQPSMQAMSSRTLSELPWSCILDHTCQGAFLSMGGSGCSDMEHCAARATCSPTGAWH